MYTVHRWGYLGERSGATVCGLVRTWGQPGDFHVQHYLEHTTCIDCKLNLRTINTQDYRDAVNGLGMHQQAYDWKDKPHRLVYDLCRAIEQLQADRGIKPLPENP